MTSSVREHSAICRTSFYSSSPARLFSSSSRGVHLSSTMFSRSGSLLFDIDCPGCHAQMHNGDLVPATSAGNMIKIRPPNHISTSLRTLFKFGQASFTPELWPTHVITAVADSLFSAEHDWRELFNKSLPTCFLCRLVLGKKIDFASNRHSHQEPQNIDGGAGSCIDHVVRLAALFPRCGLPPPVRGYEPETPSQLTCKPIILWFLHLPPGLCPPMVCMR